MRRNGFTLIELLVVIAIVGILMAMSVFGLQEAREHSRDARRKADLELIRSGLEIYRSDCGNYPLATYTNNWPSILNGDDTPTTCSSSNEYFVSPSDPTASTGRFYRYVSAAGTRYSICAAMEEELPGLDCDDDGTVDSCGTDSQCNYKVVSP
jgi:prepilin-type N-terminal cleavage/methylation domain-containing protein